MLRCIFVPNLEIVIYIGGELWHGQAQNGVNFYFEVKFDLEACLAYWSHNFVYSIKPGLIVTQGCLLLYDGW